jgi:hypothetical protein
VGFKQRERKRRRKAAQNAAHRSARESGSSAEKWWLTLATRKCCCARCGTVLGEGVEIAYRHAPGEVRCVRCAGRLEDSRGWRPALRWERSRRRDLRKVAA